MLGASAVLAGVVACKALSPDFDAIIAIDVSVKDSFIDIGDTTKPSGFAVNGRGDPVMAVPLSWFAFDTTIRVPDSLTPAAVGVSPGPGHLFARVGSLRSNPVLVNVLDTLTSIAPSGPDTVTVSAPDSISDTLKVAAFSKGSLSPNRRIFLSIPFPPGGASITLLPGDTIVTGPLGTASFRVQLRGARPDTVVISATAMYHGVQVTGSPTSFVVVFLP